MGDEMGEEMARATKDTGLTKRDGSAWYAPLVAQRWWLLIAAVLAVLLWLWQLTPYLTVANDSGRYMVLGESLARFGQLRLINDSRQPFDTLYPHGFPLIIAFWLRITGREPGGVVLPVKFTQMLFLLGTMPMLVLLLYRVRLSARAVSACLIAYAACPNLTIYANEVMSEMPMLFLCLASVLCAEGAEGLNGRSTATDGSDDADAPVDSNFGLASVPVWRRVLGLVLAAMGFMVRTSGIALLLAQAFWFWRRYGWRWGVVALLVMMGTLGGWILRNRGIVKAHPEIHYSSYIEQFTLRDPMDPKAGRIKLNAHGLASRVKSGFPAYIGFLPRTVLGLMGQKGTGWVALYYLLLVPITLLLLIGWIVVLRRGYWLTGGFAALFWFVAAMWPWQNTRFLVPILPFLFVFLFVGQEVVARKLISLLGRSGVGRAGEGYDSGDQRLRPGSVGETAVISVQMVGLALLLAYFGHIQSRVANQERLPNASGYPFGRTAGEGGFYAASAWLRSHTDPKEVVMGKPQYLLHLYAGNYTVQMEPTTNPDHLEQSIIRPLHVRYLLQDDWQWGMLRTGKILAPYLSAYGRDWSLVWTDPAGSGVKVWRRND